MLELCSESKECCTYPKGCNFEYVRFIQNGLRFFLEGKGHYGCITKLELDQKQAETWLKKYEMD